MKLVSVLIATVFAASLSSAADIEKKDETTMNTSKNPITGTVTKKKKHSKKTKGANGEMTAETTEKTKIHKDGKVETKTETKVETEKH